MPEQVFNKIKKSIAPQWKVCFLWAIIIGLIAHLYKITNWLPNWDGLVFRHDAQNMIALGRWFLPIACAPSSFYDIPWLTGILSIILHGVGAVCICRMFDVKKKVTAALIGAFVISFPAITSLMAYSYVADGYSLAFLFSCIAAMLLTQKKPRYITSALLIAFASGIYQAYITVTIMLLILYLILEIRHNNISVKDSIIKSLKFLVTGFAGMVLYYLILTVLLKISGKELLDYQGFSNVGSLAGFDFAASLYTIKESFMSYFFDFSGRGALFACLNCVIIFFTAVFYIHDIIRNKLSFGKIILLLVFVMFLPMCSNILAFLNSSIDYHNLMRTGFLVFYLFLILQYDLTDTDKTNYDILKSWIILFLTYILIFYNIVTANISYHKLNMSYEKSYGTLIRIVDRIETTDGTIDCDKIAVLGHLEGSEAYYVNLYPEITGITDSYILRYDDEVVGQSVLCSAINDYCGKNYDFAAGDEKAALWEKAENLGMNNFPEDNCIAVIDNVIVIKLSEQR